MLLRVATVIKPHGIHGEVKLEVYTDSPQSRFKPGQILQLSAANKNDDVSPTQNLTVQSSRKHQGSLLVKFSEITNCEDAEQLRGYKIWVESDDLEDTQEEGYYSHDLEKMSVFVGEEEVGQVLKIEPGIAHDYLVVKENNGNECLVPFVKQIVTDIDLSQKRVQIDPPGGILSSTAD